jgi:uncharacterized iron-regulated protein
LTRILSITLFILISSATLANELLDYYKSSKSILTLIGESHLDDKSRKELSNSLIHFKNNGGEVLGLEMVESSKQFLLDNYEENFDGSTTELANYLEKRWQYNTSSYMELIESARSAGLRLLSIDLDREKWPEETTIFPVIPDISKVRIAREAHMAKVLCENKELKTIVIIGRFHTLERFLPKQLKTECELKSKSITLKELL